MAKPLSSLSSESNCCAADATSASSSNSELEKNPEAHSDEIHESSCSSQQEQARKPRTGPRGACSICFRLKIKCDNRRPCGRCRRMKRADQCCDRDEKPRTKRKPKHESKTDYAHSSEEKQNALNSPASLAQLQQFAMTVCPPSPSVGLGTAWKGFLGAFEYRPSSSFLESKLFHNSGLYRE